VGATCGKPPVVGIGVIGPEDGGEGGHAAPGITDGDGIGVGAIGAPTGAIEGEGACAIGAGTTIVLPHP
jgi:hypothetical protein